jgi:acyl-CoA thioester hydrolase
VIDANSYPVQVHLRVRERDQNRLGVVDESVFLTYFQEARRAYVGALNALEDDFLFRVFDARVMVDQLVTVDDELAIRVRCDELSSKAFRLQYMIWNRIGRERVAHGSSILILLDQYGVDAKLPRSFRERVEALEGRSFPEPS